MGGLVSSPRALETSSQRFRVSSLTYPPFAACQIGANLFIFRAAGQLTQEVVSL